MQQHPSIFNDVIGPVMVGPSSSHTAASVRIGQLARQLAGGTPQGITFGFDAGGSLAETYSTQGVDMGLVAGIMGMPTYEPNMITVLQDARAAGINFTFRVADFGPGHPNTHHIEGVSVSGAPFALKAVSTGGGMIELIDYQGFALSSTCGFFEVLSPGFGVLPPLPEGVMGQILTRPDGAGMLHLCGAQPIPEGVWDGPEAVRLEPVLPVRSQLAPQVPFETAAQALALAEGENLALWQLAARYESVRGGLTEAEVLGRMEELVALLAESLAAPPQREGELLPRQAQRLSAVALPGGALTAGVTEYVTRFMEIKSGMGVYVAAPTGGACGCLPGAVFALAEALGLDRTAKARAMLVGGLVGLFIASRSTFAAEVAGCQAECGSGSGMAAAACVELLGGTARQGLDAASMALQNILGMVCDPVAGRVEVPCLGKNILCAQGGLSSAHMALCGFDAVVPLDETIAAMDEVGRAIPREFRCTGLGGLSVSPTSKALETRLARVQGP